MIILQNCYNDCALAVINDIFIKLNFLFELAISKVYQIDR
jgi:hypothetical protein